MTELFPFLQDFGYFLQDFGKRAWDVADSPEVITRDEFERSTPVGDNLIKRALCYSAQWGEIAFTLPLFDQYVWRPVPGSR